MHVQWPSDDYSKLKMDKTKESYFFFAQLKEA
jgi:hypothetical protein